jgi:hypothetical protein
MRARLNHQGLERLRANLSERDLTVVSSLAQHRFLTARQIEALHFAAHTTELTGARVCRRTLARLAEHRILSRLTRRSVGGLHAGSASFIYTLGPIGNRLLGGRRRVHEPSVAFLDHVLAIADVHVALAREARAGGDELVELVTEPDCWRRSLRVGGGVDVLRTDLYLVTADDEYEHCWFVEVDRGTASLPAVVRKCHQYLAYRQTGKEQDRAGTFPLVLWVTPDAERRDRVEQAIRTDKQLPVELFRVADGESFVSLMNGGAG